VLARRCDWTRELKDERCSEFCSRAKFPFSHHHHIWPVMLCTFTFIISRTFSCPRFFISVWIYFPFFKLSSARKKFIFQAFRLVSKCNFASCHPVSLTTPGGFLIRLLDILQRLCSTRRHLRGLAEASRSSFFAAVWCPMLHALCI